MKKLSDRQAMAVLRAAIALAGILCTLVVMLFINSMADLIITSLTGAYLVVLLDAYLKDLFTKTH